MKSSPPYLWDSIEIDTLHKSAKLIGTLSEQAIKEAVIENTQKYIGLDSLVPDDVSIKKHPLMNVEGAAIVAQFSKYPETFREGITQIAGAARLIQMDNEIVPIIAMFPYADETFLEHESIHLCQVLNSQTYQLTLNERIAFFQINNKTLIEGAMNTSPAQALDLLIRIACYSVWIELEAQYFLRSEDEKRQHSIVDCAYRSSKPFALFEGGVPEYGIDKFIPNAVEQCRERFICFCNELEEQVEWVRDLSSNSGDGTLHNALWWCKESDETEFMFGEKWDADSNYDDDYDEIDYLVDEEWIRDGLGSEYIDDVDDDNDD